MNPTIRYLKWLKSFNPVLFNAVMVMHPEIKQALKTGNMGYLGQEAPTTTPATAPEKTTWWQNILTTVVDSAKALIPVYQQKKILDVQLDLAKAGKPMLTNEQIAQSGTTTIQIDLPQDIKEEVIRTTQSAQTGINWGLIGIVGIGAFFLFNMTRQKRRR